MSLKMCSLFTAFLLAISTNSYSQEAASQSISGASGGETSSNPTGDTTGGSTSGSELQDQGDPSAKIAKYLSNFGKYFGYDLNDYCPPGSPCATEGTTPGEGGGAATGQAEGSTAGAEGGSAPSFTSALLDKNTTELSQLNAYSNFLGSLFGGDTNPLVPDNADSALIQGYSGQTFPSYDNPTAATGGEGAGAPLVTASKAIDAAIDGKQFQKDPMSQSVLNLLTTPDKSFCVDAKALTGEAPTVCKSLSLQQVLINQLGIKKGEGASKKEQIAFPDSNDVFLPGANLSIVPQLNTDTFLVPLLYSNKASNQNTQQQGAAGPGGVSGGLHATTQVEQAANFIRFVSGLTAPVIKASFMDYNTLLKIANNPPPGTSVAATSKAQTVLASYLSKLKVYAAQSSVGLSNLYHMMSRRLPQGQSGEGQNQTSQALSEFIMASWRLVDPANKDKPQQWLNKIQQGSQASVQKEIAVLLAEINYQLYLTRQQNERLLMTQSVMLMQLSRYFVPSASLSQLSQTSASPGPSGPPPSEPPAEPPASPDEISGP